MKIVIIKEFGDYEIPDAYTLDLTQTTVKDCLGCWTCWWKTPGRCVQKDLNEFYSKYVNADKVIIFSKVTRGFVSGNLKTLFDRMIPLFLPYTTWATGESMHMPRYQRYPDIEFYYQGEFTEEDGKRIFEDYINRVFYQFYSKNILIKSAESFLPKEAV